MKRLFFALWPDEPTRQACAKLAKTESRAGEKRVHPENLHVTLVFLGSIDEEVEAAITAAAGTIRVPSPIIVFDRLEYWRKPRIVCLTGDADGNDLADLVSQLTSLAIQHGIKVDRRPYTPHVTLIRKARAQPNSAIVPIQWKAESFCLVESRSGPNGADYRVIREWRQAPDSAYNEPI